MFLESCNWNGLPGTKTHQEQNFVIQVSTRYGLAWHSKHLELNWWLDGMIEQHSPASWSSCFSAWRRKPSALQAKAAITCKTAPCAKLLHTTCVMQLWGSSAFFWKNGEGAKQTKWQLCYGKTWQSVVPVHTFEYPVVQRAIFFEGTDKIHH